MADFVKCLFFVCAALLLVALVDLWPDIGAAGRRQLLVDVFWLLTVAGVISALQDKGGKK